MNRDSDEPAGQPLTHFDETGAARMVDVTQKPATVRRAVASAIVRMQPSTLRLIAQGHVAKGDVLQVARVAGIMAAKQTAQLIPLCHPIATTSVGIEFELDEVPSQIRIQATVAAEHKTGVEMEALTATAIAALTIYDMCKSVDREMSVHDICLQSKTGGKSDFQRR